MSIPCNYLTTYSYLELKSAVGTLIPLEKGGFLALEINRIYLPNNHYIAWDFPDKSLKIGLLDSEKV